MDRGRWTRRVQDRRLRRRCAHIIDGLHLGPNPDVCTICERVERHTGRRVALLPVPLPAGMDQAHFSDGQCDYLCFQRDTPIVNQVHLVLVDLAHLICDHHTGCEGRDEHDDVDLLPAAWGAGLGNDQIQAVAGAGHYSPAQEREAQILATMLTQLLIDDWALPEPPAHLSLSAAAIIQRLQRSLTPPREV